MTKNLSCAALLVIGMLSISSQALAQTQHGHTDQMSHTAGRSVSQDNEANAPATPLEEPGQGALAALTEVVARLRADQSTDWSRVSLATLRDHLVDMERLVIDTEVIEKPTSNGLSIRIGPENAAALRMVPAHAPVLASETGWSSLIEPQDDGGLIWTVLSDDDAGQVRALGFFGLMALGNHHRAHHWDLVTGRMVH